MSDEAVEITGNQLPVTDNNVPANDHVPDAAILSHHDVAQRSRLQGRLGCEPKLSQLAAETGMTPEEIAAVDLALIAPDSLQQETAEGLTLESTLCAEEPSVSLVERIALRDAIDALPEKERKTILLRFFKGLTQEQTARILQVSQVQVSRLERRSLQKLRDLLAEE